MQRSMRPTRYTADDLRGAAASLALEGMIVTPDETERALAVLNGDVSWVEFVHHLRQSVQSDHA
jgi:hypothetical protein